MLIGSKLDLDAGRKIQYNEGKEFADKNGMQFYEVSAKTGENVEQAFDSLIKSIVSSKPYISKQKYMLLNDYVKSMIIESKLKPKKSKWFG